MQKNEATERGGEGVTWAWAAFPCCTTPSVCRWSFGGSRATGRAALGSAASLCTRPEHQLHDNCFFDTARSR